MPMGLAIPSLSATCPSHDSANYIDAVVIEFNTDFLSFVFMAAPCCSSFLTGEILPVIGGYSA